MRILIAEDDEALARFVRQGLEGEHYSVDVLSDGEQARTAATEFEYDVVILDLNLPKLDGVSVLRHLRTKKPSVPVLVLDPADASGRPGPMPGHGSGRLPGQAIFVQRTLGPDPALLRRSHLPSESVLDSR